MLELDYLYNNTTFWLSLNTHEITYNLSTLSKRVRPLITLSFNHPKPTKGLDALSPVPPHVQHLLDQAASEDRQGGGGIVLQVEPELTPPLVGL